MEKIVRVVPSDHGVQYTVVFCACTYCFRPKIDARDQRATPSTLVIRIEKDAKLALVCGGAMEKIVRVLPSDVVLCSTQ